MKGEFWIGMQMAIKLEEVGVLAVGSRFDFKQCGGLGSGNYRAGGKRGQKQGQNSFGLLPFAEQLLSSESNGQLDERLWPLSASQNPPVELDQEIILVNGSSEPSIESPS